MSGNFIVYLIGYIIAIVGVGYGLNAAGLGSQWILAIVLVMIGLGIVYALSRAQQDKESPPASGGPHQTTQIHTGNTGSPPPSSGNQGGTRSQS